MELHHTEVAYKQVGRELASFSALDDLIPWGIGFSLLKLMLGF